MIGLGMIGFVKSDGGRAHAGYRGKAHDCVPRAIALITDRDYRDVYLTLAENRKARGFPASATAYACRAKSSVTGKPWSRQDNDADLALFGLQKVRLPPGPRPTYTQAYADYGRHRGGCLVTTRRHIAGLRDNALWDTWDGRTYRYRQPDGSVLAGERKAMSVWVLV